MNYLTISFFLFNSTFSKSFYLPNLLFVILFYIYKQPLLFYVVVRIAFLNWKNGSHRIYNLYLIVRS